MICLLWLVYVSHLCVYHCNITDCMYKGVSGWEGGGVGGGGGWEAGGGLNPPTGLFGVAMCPRSASHRPRQD